MLKVKRENGMLKKGCPPRRNLNADTFSNLMETIDFSMNCTNIDKDNEQKIYVLVLKKDAIPKAWSTSKTVLLKKKGDPEDLGNYRPITLLSQLSKLFTRLLLHRISYQLELSREQAGFKVGYSTQDHIHALSQLLKKSKEYQMPVCLASVDYR
uniref:Reverse transcriptase domain-containing protein n=1 Tax=Ascaris lumbricoides TaxID=6252 RepID=A0A0M3HL83_ASCLU